MNWKDRARKLKMDIPAIYMSLRDSETPLAAKILAGITIGYALSPIDLIPDFIPVLGYLDDIILLPLLIAITLRFIPGDIYEKNRKKAEQVLAKGAPGKWWYAVPIIIIWMLMAGLAVKIIWF